MFERVAKLVKDRARSWRLDQLARSIFLTDFLSAFFPPLRYFFTPPSLFVKVKENALAYELHFRARKNSSYFTGHHPPHRAETKRQSPGDALILAALRA
jgi:hypothetical protein